MLAALRALARAPPRPQCAFMSRTAFKAPLPQPERDDDLDDFARTTEAFDFQADVVERKTSLQGTSEGFSVDIKPTGRSKPGRMLTLPSFIKPTDLLPREDNQLGKKRPLLGPSTDVSRRLDAFHQLNIDPLLEATNPALMSHFPAKAHKSHSESEDDGHYAYSQQGFAPALSGCAAILRDVQRTSDNTVHRDILRSFSADLRTLEPTVSRQGHSRAIVSFRRKFLGHIASADPFSATGA
ncbi:hypothetical protein EVG20_g3841 [Dentipellis fragilis]|uniref:Uncharacterized protein n=1 Tax=Dentipellis fragilis TaxID=205917 RepID=A0A4Y9YZC2_9AGAM|nr:hypothetical protein EVG20_g3841 [Dentipellis fragilis]